MLYARSEKTNDEAMTLRKKAILPKEEERLNFIFHSIRSSSKRKEQHKKTLFEDQNLTDSSHVRRKCAYTELSQILNFVRGLRTTVREARNITKRICQKHRQ